MSDMDEWRTHSCTKQYIKDLEGALTELSKQLTLGAAMSGESTGMEYAKLVGWANGLQEAINHARQRDED